ITSIDVHDLARTAAFFDIAPVYLVHPAKGMHALVRDMLSYWLEGEGARRNPQRGEALKQIRLVHRLEDALRDRPWRLLYTSARPPVVQTIPPEAIAPGDGDWLVVFGTGWGLAHELLPKPYGWLSPIEGIGRVRALSVRAAAAILLGRIAANVSRKG
ncbi:MAG: hypothetical protein D6771_04920, partial [Zetaproteobacteria bacterium]